MRFWLIVFLVGGLALLLQSQFPYVAGTTDQRLRILYLVLMIALIGGGSGMARRMSNAQMARDLLLWLGIILVLVFAYSFRSEFKNSRLFAELVPSHVEVNAEGAISVDMAQDGHFHIEAAVNGVPLNFMVDTGASEIVLAPRAAQAAGYEIETLNYTRHYQTANGIVSGAPVRIDTMNVGPITLHDVPASVNNADMDESLLGMTFLKQFRGYTVDGNILTLYP